MEKWLNHKAQTLSTRTLQAVRSCLNRAVKRAVAREQVKRNVVELVGLPKGRPGRLSKALTFALAQAVLDVAVASDSAPRHRGGTPRTPLGAYVVLSLLTGARTEELRALTWDEVDLEGKPEAEPPIPPHMGVWRSVRAGGDTKTRKSRRTVALPERCVAALKVNRELQDRARSRAKKRGMKGPENNLVFTTHEGTQLEG